MPGTLINRTTPDWLAAAKRTLEFRGLCARGAFEIDCDWTNGAPARVAVRSRAGLKPDIRFRGQPLPRMADFWLETVAKAVVERKVMR